MTKISMKCRKENLGNKFEEKSVMFEFWFIQAI